MTIRTCHATWVMKNLPIIWLPCRPKFLRPSFVFFENYSCSLVRPVQCAQGWVIVVPTEEFARLSAHHHLNGDIISEIVLLRD